MAWMLTPTPGDRALCAGPCTHIDCAQHRKEAIQHCPLCDKPLGHGAQITRYGAEDDDRPPLVHWACALADRDGRRKGAR